ncbi:uncharacterized protein [Maniola hyperantus]|uniref:uncharacterized protein n=1 Tax=Aphantopus hyperantus TaxID=2795564 RepID=UPI00156833F6|nr:protein suppressor of hairy wing-like [Maniola hyperantus]
MEGFCRSCLVKYDEPTDLIPYTEKNRRMFVYATGLQAKRNDIFTFQLCKECHLNMKVACNFKKTSRNSDKKFKNYLAIKEAGDNVDFCTFLKNNDESLKFRLPMYNGSSTPANRNKDDDNESTCTSIQNFMTDILRVEEIPDIEARIIKEVIEEEADILEDSLDSHWLQDDVSMDTDLRLDFSFSPFSTPRSTINDDHCYTPKRLNDPIATDEKEHNIAIKLEPDKENHAINNFNDNIPRHCDTKENIKGGGKCVIDMNLENALKNDSAEKVMLDDLLATPPVIPNISAPSTPLINSILFGDKIDTNIDNRSKNVYMPTDMIKESEIDVLYELFKAEDGAIKEEYVDYDDIYIPGDINEKNHENDLSIPDYEKNDLNSPDENRITENIEEPSSPVENKYCLERHYCKICDRKFKNVGAIKIHLRARHKIKIVAPKRVRGKMICDYCGKVFMSSQYIVRHIKNHMNPDQYECEHCPLSFRTKTGLKSHRSTHGIVSQRKQKCGKYVCNVCGSAQSSSSNYKIHLRRHANEYSQSCKLCGKGFYRTSDLETHMRIHTGERPYGCMFCPQRFARQDTLNRHIKCHTGEKPYHCTFCNDNFVNAAVLKKHQTTSKTCLENQMEASKSNSTRKVTVYYAEISDIADVTNTTENFVSS